jgi:two-component system LytT family response regulator
VIESERPDLVLLDVQMPELDGFEVLEALSARARPAAIFVTAYDEYAVRAFEVNAVDYLLKPVEPARFTAAIDRIAGGAHRSDGRTADLEALLAELRARRRYAERLLIRTGSEISFVTVAEIDWIDAADNYVRLHAQQRTYLMRETMKALEARLDPERFLRVHRSAIVHLDRVVRMEPYFHGEYVLTLRDGTKLTASRSYSARLRAMIR